MVSDGTKIGTRRKELCQFCIKILNFMVQGFMPSQYKFVTNSKTALRLIRPLQGQTYCIAINYNIKIERLADLWYRNQYFCTLQYALQ